MPAFALEPSVMLERLNDPEYAVRQQATRALLRDTTLTPETIAEWFARAATPEQRHRLLSVARHHLIRTLREQDDREATLPAIGFSHEVLPAGTLPGIESGAVHIVATLPGFPGHVFLEPGDLVIELDDRPLPAELTPGVFQELLRRYRPGQRLALTVLREDERVRVELETASMEMLTRVYADEGSFRQPYAGEWRRWRERLLESAPPARVLSPRAAGAEE